MCLIRSTGDNCPPWVLVAGGEPYSLDLSERLRVINAIAPVSGAQVVASLRSVVEGPDQNALLLNGSLGQALTKETALDAIVRAGVLGSQEALAAWDAASVEALVVDDASSRRAGHLWSEAAKQREDGLERRQRSVERNPVDPSRPAIDRDMLRDAYWALDEACTTFEAGLGAFVDGAKRWYELAQRPAGGTPAAWLQWGIGVHKDTANAAMLLDDVENSTRMYERCDALARDVGDHDLRGQAHFNLAANRIYRHASVIDLDEAEALIQRAADFYKLAGTFIAKQANWLALWRDLGDARAGRPVGISLMGHRTLPEIPAHGIRISPLEQR